MVDPRDTFRPKALSLQAPEPSATPNVRPWQDPDLELRFHVLLRQGMFPSTQTQLKENLGLAHRVNTTLVYLTN